MIKFEVDNLLEKNNVEDGMLFIYCTKENYKHGEFYNLKFEEKKGEFDIQLKDTDKMDFGFISVDVSVLSSGQYELDVICLFDNKEVARTTIEGINKNDRKNIYEEIG